MKLGIGERDANRKSEDSRMRKRERHRGEIEVRKEYICKGVSWGRRERDTDLKEVVRVFLNPNAVTFPTRFSSKSCSSTVE